MHATLGDIEFIGETGDATYTIGANGLVGWFEGVEAQGEQASRPNADGLFNTPMDLAGRLVTISGLIITNGPVEYEAALAALAAIPTRTLTRLTVTTDAGETYADVRRVDKPDINEKAYGYLATYQLHLMAPEPRRFGPDHTYGPGTSVAVSHDGNYDGIPTIDVVGTMPSGYTVAAGGKSYVVTQALSSGHVHTIDLRTGWLYKDGVLQTGAVARAQTWVISKGATVTHTLTPASGAGTITVHLSDTYA